VQTGLSLCGRFSNEKVEHVTDSTICSSMHEIYVCVKLFFEGIHITNLAVLSKWAPVQ
jgi:hypothetical protein